MAEVLQLPGGQEVWFAMYHLRQVGSGLDEFLLRAGFCNEDRMGVPVLLWRMGRREAVGLGRAIEEALQEKA